MSGPYQSCYISLFHSSIRYGIYRIIIGLAIVFFSMPARANLSTSQFGNIRLSAHENDWKFGEEVVDIIQSALPDINKNLGIFYPITVHVLIAPTEHDFRKMTRGQVPDWGIAAADAQAGMIFLKSPRFDRPEVSIQTTVIHELCHVAIGHAVGNHSIPRWLDEGFALYTSGELGWSSNVLLGRSLLGGHTISLDAIDDVLDFQKQKAALAYRESLAAIQYLVEEYGIEALARIVLALSDGQTIDKAIHLVTGVTILAFERQWIEYLRQKYLWYAILDTRIIMSVIFVALFLLARVRKSYQSRQQHVIWEKEAAYEAIVKQENSTLD